MFVSTDRKSIRAVYYFTTKSIHAIIIFKVSPSFLHDINNTRKRVYFKELV